MRQRVLAVNVTVLGDDGQAYLWRRGETPPPEVAATFGDHVFVGGEHVLGLPKLVRNGVLPSERPGPVVPDDTAAGAATVPYVVEPPEAGEPSEVPGPEDTEELQDDELQDDLGDDLQDDDLDLENGDAGELPEPPRTGPGASRAAWREFAASLGQPLGTGLSRDGIIAHLVGLGLIDG